MIATALLASSYLSRRSQQQPTTGSNGSSKRGAGAGAAGNGNKNGDSVEERLAKIIGDSMDGNPENLRLSKALQANKTKNISGPENSKLLRHVSALDELRRRATDISDILELASDANSKFVEQFNDERRCIRLYTRSFASFPVDMVKAVAYVPCAPTEFLKMLELDVRGSWDETFKGGEMLYQDGVPNEDEFCIKVMRFDAFAGYGPIRQRDFEIGVFTRIDKSTGTAYVKAISTPYEFCSAVPDSAVRGYIPVSGFVVKPVVPRSEVVGEILKKRRKQGSTATASAAAGGILAAMAKKAMIASGVASAPTPSSSSPVRSSDSPPPASSPNTDGSGSGVVHSEITYVALVHPRGNIPVFLLNLIIGKQTAGLRNMQVAAAARSGAAGAAAVSKL